MFAERLNKRVALSVEERRFLDELEERPLRFERHRHVVRVGDPSEQAFVLIRGWAMSYTQFSDGSHQVRRLHFPGDLIAMPSVPMRRHAEDIETLSDAVIAPFDKRLLARLFELPRLAAIMYMLAQAERVAAGDRLSCLGHVSAKGRIAFLLLDILHRLREIEGAPLSSFRMHLTREQMANVAGMTPVHASRMWSELLAEHLIEARGAFVTILDEARLQRLSGYANRDRDYDWAWLAGVGGDAPPPLPSRTLKAAVSARP